MGRGPSRRLLNFAVRKKWLAGTPMTAVDLPALASGDEVDDPLRFLLPNEVHALADAALPGLYHAIDRALYLTAAFTGLRQGELRGLLWQHADFDASRVRAFENLVRGTRTSPKSRRGRSVPMARTVAQALLVVRADSNWIRQHDSVFADPVTGRPIARTPMMRRYREALTAAGLDPAFRFHDLRHTFGTSMARAGEPVTTIQAGSATATSRRRSVTCTTRPPPMRPSVSSARSRSMTAVRDVVTARYLCVMSEPREDSIAQLEEQIDGVARTMSSLSELNAREAERVAARMDRLASQLLEISPPPAMDAVYQRLGVTPASDEEFASLVDEMGAPDGEG